MMNLRSLHDLRIWIEWHGSALTAIATAAMALALAAGVVFACVYAWQVRRAAYTRRLLALLQQYQAPTLSACRAAWARKRLDNDPAVQEMRTLLEFFAMVGFTVKRGFVRAEDVWETFGSALLCFHADAQQFLSQLQRSAPESHRNFSYLVQHIQQIEKQHSGKEAAPSPEEIKTFLQQQGSTTR